MDFKTGMSEYLKISVKKYLNIFQTLKNHQINTEKNHAKNIPLKDRFKEKKLTKLVQQLFGDESEYLPILKCNCSVFQKENEKKTLIHSQFY